jgi:hypothetical protein
MRLPIVNQFAWHVFFGRGSFPDVVPQPTRQAAVKNALTSGNSESAA